MAASKTIEQHAHRPWCQDGMSAGMGCVCDYKKSSDLLPPVITFKKYSEGMEYFVPGDWVQFRGRHTSDISGVYKVLEILSGMNCLKIGKVGNKTYHVDHFGARCQEDGTVIELLVWQELEDYKKKTGKNDV